jgi:glycosyltransferase involved in cell wall biosynthesis
MYLNEIFGAKKVAVVIPCFRVKKHIASVIDKIGPEVDAIYVVDDCCPEETGKFVSEHLTDPRVRIIFNRKNLGVGGATLAGMVQAAENGADVIVKIDGDGQMNPELIPGFAGVVLSSEADYAKGNRFFEPEGVMVMPRARLIGNIGLSFMAKFSTGYWHSFDPTNGFFAIHASLVRLLPIEKIDNRYFFESDLLFRLSVLEARVVDVPMYAHYADEQSNMQPYKEVFRFAVGHSRNFIKRIFYKYFLHDFSVASIELILGLSLLIFGVIFGLSNWQAEAYASAGTVMLAAMPIIIGTQLLLAFLNYDIQSVPSTALHPRLQRSTRENKMLGPRVSAAT